MVDAAEALARAMEAELVVAAGGWWRPAAMNLVLVSALASTALVPMVAGSEVELHIGEGALASTALVPMVAGSEVELLQALMVAPVRLTVIAVSHGLGGGLRAGAAVGTTWKAEAWEVEACDLAACQLGAG